jgi:hypothetical protein
MFGSSLTDPESSMSARIAPLPDGMGVASIADRQPRRNRGGSSRAAAHAADAAAKPAAAAPAQAHAAPAANETLPPGTLFAATMLSSGMSVSDAALTELRIRRNRDWTPPESILRLRDKTI